MSSTGIEEVLFSQGVLFDLHISRWMAIKKLEKDDLLLLSVDPDAIHLGHKKLLPKVALASLAQLESEARRILYQMSADFPIARARFVRFPVLGQLLSSLKTIKEVFDENVQILLKDYKALRTQQLTVLNEQAKKLALQKLSEISPDDKPKRAAIDNWLANQIVKNDNSYPDPDILPEKFKFEWRMFKVSPVDAVVNLSPQEALQAHQKLQDDLLEWIKETSMMMHKALGAAAAKANKMLTEQGKLNPKNLKPLFDAFEMFKAIDFGDSDVQNQIDNIKKAYAYVSDGKVDYEKSANMLNTSELSKEKLANLLETMGKLAVDEVAIEAAKQTVLKIEKSKRVLQLD